MQKNKLVLLISSSIGGGAQILLLNLVPCLAERYELKIFCPAGYLADRLEKNGYKPEITEINWRTIFDIKYNVDIWADGQYVILNPFLFGTAFYVSKLFKDKTKYGVFSLLLNPIIRDDMSLIKKITYRYIGKQIGKHCSIIGVGSPELEEEVRFLAGVSPIYLENRVPNTQLVKERFYDSDDFLKVCFVGRFTEQKRPDIFVKTANITRDDKAKIQYFMVGEGHLEKTVKKYIRLNHLEDTVHLVVFQEDLYGFLGRMDILFLPSEFENTPLIILNAMNASLPVLCGNVKGVTHLIDNMVNGIVVDEYTPAAFAKALEAIAVMPERLREMSINAYQKAITDFAYEKFTSLYVDAVEKSKRN